ncbi:hypothetical protein DdX_17776 [Ditylenchus destructor]|uniref:Uncharacterized protein n=1 Tax=Ditylenchus destructor TaxID=166010 RepID=A0AAD4MNI2_9BILA|nr:hypothetical protein DdX_17776 [Ditylenchus destructor]
MANLKITVFVLLCLLCLAESTKKKKGNGGTGGEGDQQTEDVVIKGTVTVKLPAHHKEHELTHIVVMVKSKSHPDVKEKQVECKNHKCTYKDLKFQINEKGEHFQVGVALKEDHLRHHGAKQLVHGKKREEKVWSKEMAVLIKNREINFVVDLSNEDKPSINFDVYEVKIHGDVHLKLLGGHPKPEHIVVLVHTVIHGDKVTEAKSHECMKKEGETEEKITCHYQTAFHVSKDEEDYQIGAKTGGKQVWSTQDLTVPKNREIVRNFELHLPEEGKPSIIITGMGRNRKSRQKKNARRQAAGGNEQSSGGGDEE